MPSVDAWAGDAFPLSAWTDDVSKSTDFARLIADDTTSITIVRDGSAIAAQTVRIETARSGDSVLDLQGRQHNVDAIVFGYMNHDTITDTDIRIGDRFTHDGVTFDVLAVLVDLESVVQAICEATG